ncbi:lysophospholipid acyltransferase family protein [Cytobacillus purgationiresistens]|uniref:1-acyl-sn-glycerol-3-phosphate acyltransferase n=1 Tax=Cytobacillus purgationiresistens TaxID=863449 RepID=A0ABU0AL36_9BACI|nr:lysophospholipid acyltransferase family protein [Cytobacillus purgationiresistens]MDQ0271098.1 1-acyl-sn-glycerol-3-phosphate acyltransferase [Cytobacillus purgationiresistens]
MTVYNFTKTLVYGLLKPVYRMEVVGVENFPKEGGVLLCTNHIENMDPPIVGITAPRPVHFMAKEELFNVPALGKLLPSLNAFPVKRGMSDREALRKGLKVIKDGNVLGLFPEGTRSKTGEIGKGLAGAGFFALRSEAYVVPCAIIGPYKAFKKLKIVYGAPIDIASLRERRASAEETTDLIMGEISKLIQANR